VDWNPTKFHNADWGDMYPGEEELPPKMPKPHGKEVQINVFVDADHAGEKLTRRSHTGFIIMLNRAPVDWYSKRQNTVETSTFGSEFVSTRTACERVKALRYKLRMMGVPIDGPANMFCDNESVVKSAARPESQLKKKHVSLCYHAVRETIAHQIVRVAWERGETNIADLLTKSLPGPRLHFLVCKILY
jgi:hypothetical protein